MICHTELTEIFKESRDPEELKYYWKLWRDSSGKQMKKDFINMISIMDLTAKMNSMSITFGFKRKFNFKLLVVERFPLFTLFRFCGCSGL